MGDFARKNQHPFPTGCPRRYINSAIRGFSSFVLLLLLFCFVLIGRGMGEKLGSVHPPPPKGFLELSPVNIYSLSGINLSGFTKLNILGVSINIVLVFSLS